MCEGKGDSLTESHLISSLITKKQNTACLNSDFNYISDGF